MDIDTTAILDEIETTQQSAFTRSQGIANFAGFADFSREERAFVTALAEKYQKETEALQLGRSVFNRLPLVVHIEAWRTMSERSVEFLEKLESARTYEEWKVVFALAEEWFRLMREITRDDIWTALLGDGVEFFQRMSDLGGDNEFTHPDCPRCYG